MKNLFLLIFCIVTAQLSSAQSPLYIGETQLNAGFGFNNFDGLPIHIGGDYGFKENVTLGAGLGFAKNVFSIGINGNYHFDELLELPSEFNAYGGASLNYINVSAEGNSASDVDLGLQLGGRYFFTEQLAIHLEVGSGTEISGGKLGITYKLY